MLVNKDIKYDNYKSYNVNEHTNSAYDNEIIQDRIQLKRAIIQQRTEIKMKLNLYIHSSIMPMLVSIIYLKLRQKNI